MTTLEKQPFGVAACSPHTIPELLAELKRLLAIRSLQPRVIAYLNAHVYNLAVKTPSLRRDLKAARIVAADGMGIVWASRWLGSSVPERCNMTEAYHAFLADSSFPPSQAILIGCSAEEASAAALRASQSSAHCKIVQTYSGFLSDDAYRQVFSGHPEIDFIFLGMGTPRSEAVAQVAAAHSSAIVWCIGGGTIRIEAGTMREAPAFWRKTGLQWLHRLLSEPRQNAERYLLGNPLFAFNVLKAAFGRR